MKVVARELNGVKMYYQHHPGTHGQLCGMYFGNWTRSITKATKFSDTAPEDYPKHRFYYNAESTIFDLLRETEKTREPVEFYAKNPNIADNLFAGRFYYQMRKARWLYNISAKRESPPTSGRLYCVNVDTGEESCIHHIKSDIHEFPAFYEAPWRTEFKAKKAARKTEIGNAVATAVVNTMFTINKANGYK